MTTREFLAIENRLLSSFPGFAVKAKLMFMCPLNHTLRGFHFDPSGFGKRDFYVKMFLLPLYVPTTQVHLTFGHRLRNARGHLWNADRAEFETVLRLAMLEEIPFLGSLRTADKVAKALEPFVEPNAAGYVNPHCSEALAYTLIRAGRLARAALVLDSLVSGSNANPGAAGDVFTRARLIKRMLSEHPEDVDRQLLAWQHETVRNLGLEGFQPQDPNGKLQNRPN
jgi:hypothetical protein